MAVFAAGGCGGSRKARGAGPPARSAAPAARLIVHADAICLRLNTELARTAGTGIIAQSAPLHARLEKAALRELGTLTPPASLARDWAKILGYRRTLADELLTLSRAAKANDLAAVRALGVSKLRVHKELTQTAKRDGFTDCATVGPPGSSSPATPPPAPAQQARTPA
jgi:cell division inhibitor SulA